jgi:hypothetical protein
MSTNKSAGGTVPQKTVGSLRRREPREHGTQGSHLLSVPEDGSAPGAACGADAGDDGLSM